MRKRLALEAIFVAAVVAAALSHSAAVRSAIEIQTTRPAFWTAVILAASTIVASFQWGRATWLAPPTAIGTAKLVGATGAVDSARFMDYVDAALATTNRISRSILLVEIDGCASSGKAPGTGDTAALLIEVGKTIDEIADRRGSLIVAKIADNQFGCLVSACTSDQVLAMAEEMLATVFATRFGAQAKISIGICFCLPSTTTAAVLKIADDALRLAKRSGNNMCRSIAEGGIREVTRRPVRAPTLARSSSGVT